jgi:glycosyltransferase involved in cell wall biosynthesis
LRVLYLIDSLTNGGAETSLAALAPRLIDSGVILDVASLKSKQPLRQALEEAGATVITIGEDGGRLGWIRRAHRVIVERRPNLVHTTLFEADVVGRTAARLARVPVVSSLVNEAYGPEQVSDPRLSAWKIRSAQLVDAVTAHNVRRFHAITEHLADVMSLRLRISRARVDVIPRGRDPDALGIRTPDRRARVRARLGIGAEDPLLLAAARHEYQKGLDLLLKAFSLVVRERPNARLLIAGRDGNQTSELRRLTDQLHLVDEVRFMGVRTDVPDLLCAADVFVLPSRWEGLGSVLLEAMALEAPIVASDLSTIREILTDGVSARLVPPQEPGLLAWAILDVLTDIASAQRRARNARTRFVDRYTIDRVSREMMEFYQRSLGMKAAALGSERKS